LTGYLFDSVFRVPDIDKYVGIIVYKVDDLCLNLKDYSNDSYSLLGV